MKNKRSRLNGPGRSRWRRPTWRDMMLVVGTQRNKLNTYTHFYTPVFSLILPTSRADIQSLNLCLHTIKILCSCICHHCCAYNKAQRSLRDLFSHLIPTPAPDASKPDRDASHYAKMAVSVNNTQIAAANFCHNTCVLFSLHTRVGQMLLLEKS